MNSRVEAFQVNLPHILNAFENANKEFNNPYGCRLSKGIVTLKESNLPNFVKETFFKF
jgi:hypothetical protein